MNRKRSPQISGLFCLLFVSQSFLSAQDITLSSGSPAEVNMNEEILYSGVTIFKEAVEKDKIRNVVLLVARNGKVVLHEAMGWKDKDKGIPLKKDAMFRMASNTKPLVATGVSILCEEKKIGFNDYIRKHIPSFDNYRSGSITVHHLLTHTSGFRIRQIFYQPLIQKSKEHPDAPNLLLEVNRFGDTGAEVEPGTSYSYSNPGFNTLGALVEVISQKKLDVFLKEKIYDPLGMHDTYHHEVAEKLDGKLDRMSVVYYKQDGKWTIGWQPGNPPQYPFVRASGGMISTAMDYARFCQMFLNGGVYNGKRILKKETVELMTSPHTRSVYSIKERENMDSFYGYGWRVNKDGSFAHSGSDGTAVFVNPDLQLIVLVFTQSPGEFLGARFYDLVKTSINE